MKTTKCLGIWMDHANANLMEFTCDPIETKIVHSKFTHQEKEETLNKSEHVMHNKEQYEERQYYNKLGDVIKNYDEVILFGPTQAKAELFNLLRADRSFEKIKIDVKHADKMTENQQHTFVKEHFARWN